MEFSLAALRCYQAILVGLVVSTGAPHDGLSGSTSRDTGTVKSDVPDRQTKPTATLKYGVESGRCSHGADTRVTVETPNGSISTSKKNQRVKTSDPTCSHE